MYKIYIHPKCSTCIRALKYLDKRGIKYTTVDIRSQTPTLAELKSILSYTGANIKNLFNTSGMKYRELGLKDKLPTMTESDKFQLLISDGMLIKRPLLIDDTNKLAIISYKQEEYDKLK